MVSGDGTISVLRYGGILQARQLVGVRGAGLAFDGLVLRREHQTPNQARGIQTEFHAEAERAGLQCAGRSDGAILTTGERESIVGNFFGKYRGTVINNVDPMQIGRLMVQVPDVSNVLPSTWAMPCAPFAGIQSGSVAVPPDRRQRVGGV